jgi:hypothetical protein
MQNLTAAGRGEFSPLASNASAKEKQKTEELRLS